MYLLTLVIIILWRISHSGTCQEVCAKLSKFWPRHLPLGCCTKLIVKVFWGFECFWWRANSKRWKSHDGTLLFLMHHKHGFIYLLAMKQIRSENAVNQSSFLLCLFCKEFCCHKVPVFLTAAVQFTHVGCVLWLLLQEEQNVSRPWKPSQSTNIAWGVITQSLCRF